MHLITIIVPCYNHGDTLGEALDSIIAQTWKEWKCVIVNDGSSDNTESVAHQYENKDKRFSYIRQSNNGPSAARNYGAAHADSKYLMFLDADDKLSEDYLNTALPYMESHPDCQVFFSSAKTFGGFEDYWDWNYSNYKNLLRWNSICCCCVLRKNEFDKIGGFDVNLCGYEDWEFFIRLLYNNDSVYQEKKPLFYYRVGKDHDGVNTKAMNRKRELSIYIYIKNIDKYCNFWGTPFSLIEELECIKLEDRSKIVVLAKTISRSIQKIKKWIKW